MKTENIKDNDLSYSEEKALLRDRAIELEQSSMEISEHLEQS